jgi:hypothetical protein
MESRAVLPESGARRNAHKRDCHVFKFRGHVARTHRPNACPTRSRSAGRPSGFRRRMRRLLDRRRPRPQPAGHPTPVASPKLDAFGETTNLWSATPSMKNAKTVTFSKTRVRPFGERTTMVSDHTILRQELRTEPRNRRGLVRRGADGQASRQGSDREKFQAPRIACGRELHGVPPQPIDPRIEAQRNGQPGLIRAVHRAALRFAAISVFDISIAIVIGPTPPGTGVIAAACAASV